MNNQAFNKIVNGQLDYCKSLLITKGDEYAITDIDRLSNFKNGASILQTTPMECLLGYWTKHLSSIIDMVHSNTKNGTLFTKERWIEKITDSINYLILLEALVLEKIEGDSVNEQNTSKSIKS